MNFLVFIEKEWKIVLTLPIKVLGARFGESIESAPEANNSLTIGGGGAGFFFLYVPPGVDADPVLPRELFEAYMSPRCRSFLR